jgi:hypothetical protein
MTRRLLALAVLAALGCAVATGASAARRPSAAEARAIRTAAEAFIRKEGTPAAKDNRIIRVVVSTVSPQYARVDVRSKLAGPALMLLRARSDGWKVITFGSGGFGCNLAPRAVLRDLIGGCVP